MTTRSHRVALAALLTCALAVPLLGAAPATASQQAPAQAKYSVPGTRSTSAPELPRPAGQHPVGRRALHLVDRHRTDPWVPTARGRELLVTVSYPARRAGDGAPAAYMTTDEARLLLEARGLAGVVPAETLAGTRTHARVGAAPARGRFPLVLLSPGFGMPRATLTSLADDLASRGYVVAAVDHAYESLATEFPGGRVMPCVACEEVDGRDESGAVVRGRAADLSFVIDELTDRRRTGALARVIDPRRIGAAGHSIGGATAAATMAADRRVRAGVDLDGDFFVDDAGSGLGRRPFMMVGAANTHSPGSDGTDWAGAWDRLHGWKRWLTVEGAGHFSFTDFPWLGDRLGLPTDPEAPLSGERSWYVTRDYVHAFFDRHLRGIPQPLLHGPTASRPEVEFHRP
ncbi:MULTISPECIES: alpha/beta hydrolase [unclassified Streptomyces]|uniref:alpha/beta hydrolase family protein n=1 Tax=Streptomyces TaxID=1883 RepID=UPI0025B5D1E6|nr:MULTISPECIES: alpha/beta hydrolase [unclassified Streptomyces]MDN3245635.1 alpha/beta hydrolase [Streptomyces sp. ZSW22]MDN3253936.1 alpha/beta hydrolase [Streptomyces sp. MA25(2023)]